MPKRSISTWLKYLMMAFAGATGANLAKHDNYSAGIGAAITALLAAIAAVIEWRNEKREAQRLKDELELLSPPGATIGETMQAKGMDVSEFAEAMGTTNPVILALIIGKIPIDEVIATRLERVLGIDAQFWLNSEVIYRRKLAELEKKLCKLT